MTTPPRSRRAVQRWLSRTLLAIACASPLASTHLAAAEAGPVEAEPAVVAGEDALPVQRVVLYSAGVGYFEHAGQVTGDAIVELQFTAEQINDILKSLLIQDLDGGRVASVAYPSQEPLTRLLSSFAVNLDGHPSLIQLLAQLRGAEVLVDLADQQVRGAILGIESRNRAAGDSVIAQSVLNVVTDQGIRSLTVDQVASVQLADPQLQRELVKALQAVAEARSQDKKPITIRLTGEGERRVALGYVVEAPVWKTSYRLVLPPEGDVVGGPGSPILQGWAIVENTTDHDWNGVELSLVSGRPIAFIENLYRSIYLPRPVVEAERYAALAPQDYADGIRARRQVARGFGGREEADAEAEMAVMDAVPAAAAPVALAAAGRATNGTATRGIDPTAGVQSVASAEEVGELFQYTVGDVDLSRRRSAMLPVITSPIEVQRLSIYNASSLTGHPLRGARLTNSTDLHLLQGPVTVVDSGSYAGDARIDDMPPGADRLVSYAIDLAVNVQRQHPNRRSSLLSGTIVNGVLRLQRQHRLSTTYAIENNAETERTLLLEHPLQHGWELVDTPEPLEQTESLYRFEDTVAAGERVDLQVTEQRVAWESLRLLNTNINTLRNFAEEGRIPPTVRAALQRTLELHAAVQRAEREINQIQAQIRSIGQEQQRIRQNMNSVDRASAYYNRMLRKLDQQETQIESLQADQATATDNRNQARAALERFLHELNVE